MRPIVLATVMYAAGCAAGLRVGVPLPVLCVLVLAAAATAIWQIAAPGVAAQAVRRPAGPVLCGFVLAGLAAGGAGARGAAADCRATLRDGARLEAIGVLEGLPAPGAATLLDVQVLRVDGEVRQCRGAVRVRIAAADASPDGMTALGSVRVSGRWWVTPQTSRWPVPGQRHGTLSATAVESAPEIAGRPLLRARLRAQARVRSLFGERAGIVEAVLLARTEALDPALRDAFAAAGLSHLLAISGSHVGLVAGAILLLAQVARLSTRRANAAAAALTVAYVLFLGAPSAASRAALQVLMLLGARLTQRPADPFALMATAALVLLCLRPLALLEAGFQLSFAGVFGLLAFRRPLLALVPARWPRTASDSVMTTIAATLTTAPIAGYRFGMVSGIGILANLVAVPALALSVPASALALVAATVHEGAGQFLAGGAAVPLYWLERTARLSAAVPGGHVYVGAPSVTAALLGTVAFILVRRGSVSATSAVRRRRTLLGVAAAVLLFTLPPLPRPGAGALEIHAIDVGQGDAFAIRTPAGRWLLVDAGPRSERFDAGRSRVLPYLRSRGARSIAALVLTHPHTDHIGGAPAILRAMRVAAVLDPAQPAQIESYHDLLSVARETGVRWYAAREGRELTLDGVTLSFLAPEADLLDAPADPNDYSLVLRLAWGGFGALFTGDAPASVENEIVAQYGAAGLHIDLLKVGHHGSRTSTGDSLLRTLRPRLALVSAGARNRYGHPDPGVVRRLERHGVRVLRTDERGTIVVRVSPSGTFTLMSER